MMMHPVTELFAFHRALGWACGPIDWFERPLPLTSIIIICSWEWGPFAFLILLTALQSLDERAEGGGTRSTAPAPFSAWFFYIIAAAPRAAPTSVVIMIETIFFLDDLRRDLL